MSIASRNNFIRLDDKHKYLYNTVKLAAKTSNLRYYTIDSSGSSRESITKDIDTITSDIDEMIKQPKEGDLLNEKLLKQLKKFFETHKDNFR